MLGNIKSMIEEKIYVMNIDYPYKMRLYITNYGIKPILDTLVIV